MSFFSPFGFSEALASPAFIDLSSSWRNCVMSMTEASFFLWLIEMNFCVSMSMIVVVGESPSVESVRIFRPLM